MAIRAAGSGRRRCRRPTAAGSSTSRSTTASRTSSSARSAAASSRNAAAVAHRRRPGPSARRPPAAGSTRGTASGESVGWLADGAWVAATGEREIAPAGPVAAAGSGRRAGRRATAPGHRFAAGRPARRPVAVARAQGAARRRHGARRAPRRGHPLASEHRDGQARRDARPDDHLPARRPDRPGIPLVPAVQAAPRRGGVRGLRRRLPRVDRLRPGIPRRQPRRVGSRRRPRPHRRRALGRRAAVVGRPAGDLRRLVRRLHGPVRARRRALDVARRRRPVRRFRDRRELPPRRPARPARPAQDDGLAGRRRTAPMSTGAARRSIARNGSRRRC